MFLLFLSSACITSRPFLLLTPLATEEAEGAQEAARGYS